MCSAKECSSTDVLVGKLVEFGFASSAETRSSAADIYAKVPRKASGISVSFELPSFVVHSNVLITAVSLLIKSFVFFFLVTELPETGKGGSKACQETEHLQAAGR